MRNLKRALSLVMAMALIVGMMVVSASAASTKDFTDKDEIQHTEAVNTMVALNVIAGKEDGSYYDPTGTLTRAEMAKVVAFVMNGGVEPNIGTKVIPTYSDIDNHWAEAYIEYCTSMGIIAGDGAGKFNPEGTLTAEQCAKMFLTAIGYDANVFGFTGNDWAMNVGRYANEAGLYEDLGDVRVSQPISRDDAAQMAYNAIQATMMHRAWNQDMQTGEITEVYEPWENHTLFTEKFNGTIYEGVLMASGYVAPYGTSETAGRDRLRINVEYVNNELVEGYPNGSGARKEVLSYATDCTDMIGEYVKVLYDNKSKNVYGVYVNDDETAVSINTTLGALSDINDPANTVTFDGTTYDVDAGAPVYFYDHTDATPAWDSTTYDVMNLLADAGETHFSNYDNVRLVDNDGDEIIDLAIVTINQIEKVTYVGSSSVTLTNKGEVKSADAVYADLAVDDFVSYVDKAYSYSNKIVLTEADAITGEVNEVRKTDGVVTSVLVDGTWYTLGLERAAGKAPIEDTDGDELDYKLSYDLALVNGYIVNAAQVAGSNIQLAVVTGSTGTKDYDGNYQVRLLLANGDTVEGYMTSYDIPASAPQVGDFVGYTIENNVYKAVKPEAPDVDTGKYAGYDGYDASTGLGDDAFNSTTKKVDGATTDIRVNNNAVVFVQYDKDLATATPDPAFTVISGADLNAWKSNWGDDVEFLWNNTGLGYADVVYITGAVQDAVPGIKNTYGYITSAITEGQDSTGVYSSFTIWDGIDSYDVIARKSIATLGATKGSAISFEWDGETTVKSVTALGDTGALTYSNGEQVKINTTGYDLADDVVIINVSTKDAAGVAGSAIAYAAQTEVEGVYYENCWFDTNTDGEIAVLIIDVTSNKISDNTVVVGSDTLVLGASTEPVNVTVGNGTSVELTAMQAAGSVLKMSAGGKVTFETGFVLGAGGNANVTAGSVTITAQANGGWKIEGDSTSTVLNVTANTGLGKEVNNFYNGSDVTNVTQESGTVTAGNYTWSTNMKVGGTGSDVSGWFRDTDV